MEKETRKLSALSIVGIVLIAVFLPIIIINLTIVVKGWIHPDRIPMVFNRAPLIVVSDSMTIEKNKDGKVISGAFNKNDLIIVQRVKDTSILKVGDIITYTEKDGAGNQIWTTHRISRTNEDGSFYTRGDYSPNGGMIMAETLVKADNVQGLYTGVRFAKLGQVALFFQTVPGIIVLLVIPLAAIGILYFVENAKSNKEAQGKNAELEAELARLKAEKEQSSQPTEEPNEEPSEEVEEQHIEEIEEESEDSEKQDL